MFNKKILIGDGKLTIFEVLLIALIGFLFSRSVEAAGKAGYNSYVAKNYTAEQIFVKDAADSFNIRRYWDGRNYGTLWDFCGSTITADHVISNTIDNGEGQVGKTANRNGGIADVVHYGNWECESVTEISQGDVVSIIGFPGGSSEPSMREGSVYIKRSVSGSDGYETPTWIVAFKSEEPVVGGMSGGIVIKDNEPVGVLVVQNSPADLDGDGKEDHSSDIVSLADYHMVLSNR